MKNVRFLPSEFFWLRPVQNFQLRLLNNVNEVCLVRLHAVMKSDLKCSTPWIKEFLGWIVCVKWPRVLKKRRTICKQGGSSPYSKRETGVNEPTTGSFLSLASLEKYMPSALKKDEKNNWVKAGQYPVHFSSRPKHYSPNFHSPVNFREIIGVHQRRLHMFFRPRESIQRVPREKLWEVLREYCVDCRLLLAVKSLYSCSDVCVCVGGVKSQPSIVGVGLRQRCVLSPLLFIV